MLKCWHIENFKAIVNSGDLKLAPVTVFAGLNSAGKSSLLQSILMISQTLRDNSSERALVLNGPIVQLGSFEEILSNYSKEKKINISFNIEQVETKDITTLTTIATTFESYDSVYDKDVFLTEGHSATYYALSENFVLENHNEFELDFSKKTEKQIEENNLQNIIKKDSSIGNLNVYNYQGVIKVVDENDSNIKIHLSVNHFLPDKIVQQSYIHDSPFNNGPIQYLKEEFLEYLSDFMTNRITVEDLLKKPFDFSITIPIDLIYEINESASKDKLDYFNGNSLLDLFIWGKLIYQTNFQSKELSVAFIFSFPDTVSNILEEIIVSSYKDKEHLYDVELKELDINLVTDINHELNVVKGFFARNIRYLGPLRLEPKELQRFPSNLELGDVGSRGEYAAAIYDNKKNTEVEWYNPNTNEIVNNTLQEALNSWVRYLKVADEVLVKPEGHNGYSWQVRQAIGYKPVPLAAVGVGVSQILPILVTGLLSPEGSLLIIEQPELHLHPRVQSLLGDFFMSLAKCGKQCLIETHSENLVNRLRLHIVKAGGMDKSDCLIYFAHQEPEKGAIFEPIEVSPKGNIMNWPEGFFDVTIQQEEEILFESLKRRANKNA